ncbi:MAG: riboflavin synthase [Cyclobacteriaceae bacterium]
MFTGIIESVGEIKAMEKTGTNVHFDISSNLTSSLKVDQSLNHNGVCLTVVKVNKTYYRVTAIEETLSKSNLGNWEVGDNVNLERCMPATGRFDGHIVQGHVDQVGSIISIEEMEGSWVFRIKFDPGLGNITVEKGSICVNGTSLTCFNSSEGKFSVALIPYTYEHTIFHLLQVGNKVNLEFDILGKYIQRIIKGY